MCQQSVFVKKVSSFGKLWLRDRPTSDNLLVNWISYQCVNDGFVTNVLAHLPFEECHHGAVKHVYFFWHISQYGQAFSTLSSTKLSG